MATSPNSLNKIYITVESLDEALSNAIEKGDIGANDDFKIRARKLADDYGWDVAEARKFGHPASAQMGVKFSIIDAVLADNMGADQMVETARRAINASILLANPALFESVHSATIQIPGTASSIASDIITKQGGNIFSEVKAAGASPYTIEAYIPAKKSSGLEAALQIAIKGQVSVQLVHVRWQPLEGDPLDPESQTRSLAVELRQEKGLPAEIPSAETYLDKA
ncbi:Elongation factor 2 [Orbilia oligospora]|nr:Elongation factor 2 [Orbilia oligospora]